VRSKGETVGLVLALVLALAALSVGVYQIKAGTYGQSRCHCHDRAQK